MKTVAQMLQERSAKEKRALLAELLQEVIETATGTPLSHGQQALWFLQQLDPDSVASNLMGAWYIRTAVEEDVLRHAFQQLLERHPSLRTAYTMRNGRPVQRVVERSVSFLVHQAQGLSVADVQEAVAVEAHRPFDLSIGEVLRAHLFRTGGEDVLLLVLHHIAVDGWSIVRLMEDLQAFYAAGAAERTAELPPIHTHYREFVHWQEQLIHSEKGQRQLDYWRAQLAGELPLLHLPLDRPRPPVQTHRGAVQVTKLEREATAAIGELARQVGTTPYTVLLAAYQVLLHRLSGQDDVIVGTFLSGRSLAKFQEVVGYFVNPVALRTDFSTARTFAEFLEGVQDQVLEALDHQDYPFPLLVEQLQPDRDPSASPVFQAAFVYENFQRAQGREGALFVADGSVLDMEGLALESFPFPQRVAQFDLTLLMEEAGGRLHMSLQYNTDLFDPATAERMLECYRVLVHGILAHPHQPLPLLPLLSDRERDLQMVSWNQTRRDIPTGRLMHELLERGAAMYPERPAARYYEQVLTYGELNAAANQVAHRLIRMGVGPDRLVGVCMERSLEMIVAIFGVLKAGGAYVPIDPSYPEDRVAYMADDSGVEVFLTQERLLEKLPTLRTSVICLDRDRALLQGESTANPDVPMEVDHLAYMIYTSGSTGRPKGVMVEHRGIWNLAEAQIRTFDLQEGVQVLQFASFSFDAWGFEVVMALRNGGTICLAERDDLLPSPTLLSLLRDQRIQVVTLPPSVLALLPDAELPDLQTIITAGEACTTEIVDRWQPGRRFFNAYGPSEATVWITAQEVFAGGGKPMIGQAVDNFELYVLDPHLQLVPIGVAGELHVGGIGLARGYRNRPDLTAEKFIPHPFDPASGKKLYKTGDLVRRLPDGTLDFLGRMDHQVKIRGFRIEVGEIEAVLHTHPDLMECVLLVREDTPGDKRLIAYAVPRTDQVTTAQLRRYLKTRLPEYMVPTAFVLLAELPLTPNGKIDRRALPAPTESQEFEDAYREPSTEEERVLAELYAEVLGLARVGADDHFFERGGHSLLAAQLMARVREKMGVELPIRRLFEAPTVAELAICIADVGQAGDSYQPLVRVPRDEELMLSFHQERLWFLHALEPGNAAYNIPTSLRLHGALDVAVLERVLNEIQRRHESLRTTMSARPQGAVLQIKAPSSLQLPVTDLSKETKEVREAQALHVIRADAQAPFDIVQGPLVRYQLLRLASDEHILLLTMHHIISDGWSVHLFVKEMAELYRAFVTGQPSPLSELEVQYADFARWQRDWLQGEALATQLDYWKHKLGGSLPVLDLPRDFPRPSMQTYRGQAVSYRVPSATLRRVKELCQQEGVTLFMVLLAAFQTLLYRQTGLEDIIVGAPTAGRSRRELEPLIGFFINTLVLRTDLSGQPTFLELLRRVRDTTLDAFAHQEIPFEKLVEVLKPERDFSRPPLFQVMFNLLNLAEEQLQMGDIRGEVIPSPEIGSKFDLTLYVKELADQLQVEVVFNPDLYTAKRMQLFVEQWGTLVAELAAHPERPIGEFPCTHQTPSGIDPTAELSVAWEGSIVERLASQVVERSEQAALCDAASTWSYRELEENSNRVAHALRQAGIGRGDVVTVFAHRSAALVVALLGVWKAGAAFAILDPSYPANRLAAILRASCAVGWLQVEAAGAVPEELAHTVDELDVRLRLTVPPTPSDVALQLAMHANQPPEQMVGPDDLAYLAFTSGTTGVPKGIQGTHRPLSHFLKWHSETFGLLESDRFSMLSGLAHDPLLRDLFTPLWVGGTLYIPQQAELLNPEELSTWMHRQGITVAHLTPALGQVLTDEQQGVKLPHLRYAFFGGDVLPVQLVARVQRQATHAIVVNFYGATETPQAMGYQVVMEPVEQMEAAHIPVGRGISDVQLLVLNAGRGLAGVGEVGEIYVRTPYLTRGYLAVDQVDEAFLINPFTQKPEDRLYRTGDAGRYRLDGSIEYLGRLDQMVKIRGFRIELGEVESALQSDSQVKEALVLPQTTPDGEKRLIAYLIAWQESSVDVQELRASLRQRLPEYMMPSAFVTLPAFPLTPNGKIDRRALPQPDLETAAPTARYTAPESDWERRIATVWGEVLGRERVGVHDNFFDLGGHSLLMMRVHARLQELKGGKLSMVDLFQHPTVRSLALHLSRAEQVSEKRDAFQGVQDRVRKQKEAMKNRRRPLRKE